MKPEIDTTQFGSITIKGKKYKYDVYISLDGTVQKRKKKLSKNIYGTSHIISLNEIEYIFEEKADSIVIGSGQYGEAKLSFEADEFLKKKNCRARLHPTPQAVKAWNEGEGRWLGLFHVTC